MSITLLDVNVLLALAWPNHPHHDPVERWFLSCRDSGWATCPITQAGFVRVSSNARMLPDAVPLSDAVEALRDLTSSSAHQFWKDELQFLDSLVPHATLRGHKQVTDAYLIALARHHHGRLATLDRGMQSLLQRGEDLVDYIQ